MIVKEAITEYLKHLKTLNRSVLTIRNVKSRLKKLLRFLEQEQAPDLLNLNQDLLEAFQQDLAFSLTARGTLLSIPSQIQALGTVRDFTAFLKHRDYLAHDPGEQIELPKSPQHLPKIILTGREIKRLFKGPDRRTNRGFRNRLILELLYDTAIRREELSRIRLMDLDLQAGFIRIQGKGQKERVVPVSARVSQMIRDYLLAVRPALAPDPDPGFLFLNRFGGRMHANGVGLTVKRSVRQSGLKKNITTHTFRHTCATHMLRNGAPVRHIQELLGHASLESTQIYTRVAIHDLKKIHAKYHPNEKAKSEEPSVERMKKTESRSQNPE